MMTACLTCHVLRCAVLCPHCVVLTYVLHVTLPLQAQVVLITSNSTLTSRRNSHIDSLHPVLHMLRLTVNISLEHPLEAQL